MTIINFTKKFKIDSFWTVLSLLFASISHFEENWWFKILNCCCICFYFPFWRKLMVSKLMVQNFELLCPCYLLLFPILKKYGLKFLTVVSLIFASIFHFEKIWWFQSDESSPKNSTVLSFVLRTFLNLLFLQRRSLA